MNGEYVTAGETLATLVPTNAEPWVIANIRPQDAVKLGADSKVSIAIAGAKTKVTGKIVDMKSAMAEEAQAGMAGLVSNVVLVRIAPDQKQPNAMAGRPAQVVFEVK
jgi:multidrug resistance efflux pump